MMNLNILMSCDDPSFLSGSEYEAHFSTRGRSWPAKLRLFCNKVFYLIYGLYLFTIELPTLIDPLYPYYFTIILTILLVIAS